MENYELTSWGKYSNGLELVRGFLIELRITFILEEFHTCT